MLTDLTVISRNGDVLGRMSNGDDVISIYTTHREELSHQDFDEISSYINETLDLAEVQQAASILQLEKEFYLYFRTERLNTNNKYLTFMKK